MNFALVFFLGYLAPLQGLRFLGLNFTYYDVLLGLTFGGLAFLGRLRVIKNKMYWVLSAGIVISSTTSAIFTYDAAAALQQVLQWAYILFIAIPVVYSICRTEIGAKSLMYGVIIGGGCLVCWSIIDVYSGNAQYVGGRYAGFMNSPQPTSFIISCLFCFFLSFALFERKKSFRFLASFMVIGSIIIVSYAASRTGLIALAICTVLITALYLRFNSKSLKSIGRYILTLLLLIGVTVWASDHPLFSDFVAGSTEKLSERIEHSFEEGSSLIQARVDLFGKGIDSIGVRAVVLGYGLENYVNYGEGSKKPHNVIILYFLEGGIIFVICLVGLMLLYFKHAYLSLKLLKAMPSNQQWMVVACVSSFLIVLIIGLFNTSIILRFYWLGFAILLGLADRWSLTRLADQRSIGGPA